MFDYPDGHQRRDLYNMDTYIPVHPYIQKFIFIRRTSVWVRDAAPRVGDREGDAPLHVPDILARRVGVAY